MKSLYSLLFVLIVGSIQANNMLVQNVTTLGNDAVNKTIQVQFDISWDNSWRDEINYDAAWIFMKFKDANGLWQHVQLNQTGFVNGIGTANTVQVTNDKVGCWLYRTGLGTGTFNSTGMQLQWNYGLAGLTNVTGLEVRVFAVEMVYVPEGEFNCAPRSENTNYNLSFLNTKPELGSQQIGEGSGSKRGQFYAPNGQAAVINSKLTPTLLYSDNGGANSLWLRIKGNSGIDFNNDGVIENNIFPTGYKAFYCPKYEITEQQYSDYLNTLTATQISSLAAPLSNFSLSDGQYFSSSPNKAFGYSNVDRFFSLADWLGLRPMTFLEYNKACYGPIKPIYLPREYCAGGCNSAGAYPSWGCNQGTDKLWQSPAAYNLVEVTSYSTQSSNRCDGAASYYGIVLLTGNSTEPVINLTSNSFNPIHGDGQINLSNGNANVVGWPSSGVLYIESTLVSFMSASYAAGYRCVRSAE